LGSECSLLVTHKLFQAARELMLRRQVRSRSAIYFG
jgi:hypothetical protein